MRLPAEEHYSTRCRISHRPDFQTAEPVFFRCPRCGGVVVASRRGEHAPLPTARCCGEDMHPLKLCRDEAALKEHTLNFVVFGGLEHSAVRLSVDDGGHPMEDSHRIEWLYLRTFQGGQLKFLAPRGRSAGQFALADDDAYVYCDRAVCRMGREHCQFACKRGMVAYAYCSRHGLFRRMLTGRDGQEPSCFQESFYSHRS